MILIVSSITGLCIRAVAGRTLAGLSHVHLRGEMLLLVLLVCQAAIPALQSTGIARDLVRVAWIATYPALILICVLNRRQPGMLLLGLGLTLNFAVVAANGAMPVLPSAAALARPDLRFAIATADFTHVAAGAATKAVWLADIIPIPGPQWIATVASAGDALLLAGIAAFLAKAESPENLA